MPIRTYRNIEGTFASTAPYGKTILDYAHQYKFEFAILVCHLCLLSWTGKALAVLVGILRCWLERNNDGL
jgi:hypothetical protein